MQTIMMGKMEMVLPDMYMINKFMGICFRGPRATSQQRCMIQTERNRLNSEIFPSRSTFYPLKQCALTSPKILNVNGNTISLIRHNF